MDQTLTLSKDDVQARCATLGWSQNLLARRIKKNPGYVSGVLSGRFTSSVVMKRIERTLQAAERRLAVKNGGAGPVEHPSTRGLVETSKAS